MKLNKNKKEILDYIIYIHHLNKVNGFSLEEPEIYKYSNKVELELFLQKNQLVITDYSLVSQAHNLDENKTYYYYLYNGQIDIYFSQYEQLIFETKDNIITLKSDINNKHPHLMQLSKIFYFRKFISGKLYKGHEMNNSDNNIILIKKDIISQYISYFNFEKLSNILNGINIDYKNLEQTFEVIIDNLKKKDNSYLEDIKSKEIKSPTFNFYDSKFNLIPKKYNNVLLYLSNFELIDEEIFQFFKENQMIKDEQVIKGQFIAEDVKIFLVYIYNSRKYYEIGSLDTINWTFTIEKILEETSLYKKNIFEYFNNQGIKVLLQKVENNLIKLGNNVIALCYDVQISENEEEEDYKIMQDNQYNIKDVVSTLLSLYKFEESVKMKLELSKTQNNANSGETSDPFSTLLCTLVNQTFINEIKQLFDFQKLRHIINIDDMNLHLEINDVQVEKILKKDKLYEKFLIGKKKEFLDIKQRSSELIKIDIITFENEENKFNYPINFNVIDSKLFDKFLNIFDLKRADIIDKTEEIFIAFNYGNIVFRGMNEKCFSNHIFLLYIYSSVFQQKSDKVFYFQEIILKFQNYPDLINNFQTITKENIKEELIYKQEYFLSKYGCKMFLISNQDKYNNDKQKISETDLYNNNLDTYFNKLLTFSLEFSIIYNNF